MCPAKESQLCRVWRENISRKSSLQTKCILRGTGWISRMTVKKCMLSGASEPLHLPGSTRDCFSHQEIAITIETDFFFFKWHENQSRTLFLKTKSLEASICFKLSLTASSLLVALTLFPGSLHTQWKRLRRYIIISSLFWFCVRNWFLWHYLATIGTYFKFSTKIFIKIPLT